MDFNKFSRCETIVVNIGLFSFLQPYLSQGELSPPTRTQRITDKTPTQPHLQHLPPTGEQSTRKHTHHKSPRAT